MDGINLRTNKSNENIDSKLEDVHCYFFYDDK